MIDIDVKKSGPIFDGRAERAVEDFLDEATDKIAEVGRDEVGVYLSRVMKHPTGRYVSHLHVVKDGIGNVVTDGGVVYGPWLEGEGERNRSTRFKGYRAFRIIGQQLQLEADQIAEGVLPPYLERMR